MRALVTHMYICMYVCVACSAFHNDSKPRRNVSSTLQRKRLGESRVALLFLYPQCFAAEKLTNVGLSARDDSPTVWFTAENTHTHTHTHTHMYIYILFLEPRLDPRTDRHLPECNAIFSTLGASKLHLLHLISSLRPGCLLYGHQGCCGIVVSSACSAMQHIHTHPQNSPRVGASTRLL